MPTSTIDILLNLQSAKGPGLSSLTSDFEKLENRAKRLQQGIDAALNGGGRGELAGRFQKQLASVNAEMQKIDATARKMALDKKLLAAKDAANKLRESMQRVQQIGQQMTIAGAAILGTLTLVAKKYLDVTKEGLSTRSDAVSESQKELESAQQELDTLSKKKDISDGELQTARAARDLAASNVELRKKELADFQKKEASGLKFLKIQDDIEASMQRIGKVIIEQVTPYAEKFAGFMKQVADFAEKNPDAVKAGLGIGGSLVVLGGLIAATAQIVSTIATIQGLAASAGIALGGGGAVAGAGAAAGGAGLSAAVAAGFTAAIPFLLTGLAVWAASELTLSIMNAILGTNQTWYDLLATVQVLVTIVENGFNNLANNLINGMRSIFGNTATNIILAITQATSSLWMPLGAITQAINGLRGLFGGGRASGGYMDRPAFYAGAERGREFVMNANTTRNAERAIGGRLNQSSALGMITNNFQMANGATIAQTRRMIRESENRQLAQFAQAFA